jgi:hypothetical protein
LVVEGKLIAYSILTNQKDLEMPVQESLQLVAICENMNSSINYRLMIEMKQSSKDVYIRGLFKTAEKLAIDNEVAYLSLNY